MSGFEDIREHMEVIGADGVHLGTVDRVEDNRIKLIRADSGVGHEEHHHYIPAASSLKWRVTRCA